jgi:hypothetical protein
MYRVEQEPDPKFKVVRETDKNVWAKMQVFILQAQGKSPSS